MNAGAFGGEIADRLVNIEAICPKGKQVVFQTRDVGFGYRTAKGLEDHVILYCSFLLDTCSPQAIADRRRMLLQQRREIQPLRYPSCGSVFRRREGVLPGRLIDEAGCKGLRIGDALVSRKHANFIINGGGATARDIWSLIQEVKKRVKDQFGIELELEVQAVGRF
jgi:UDP-N-acetylmuramate dehydrogenase